jgi:hypothetical protein
MRVGAPEHETNRSTPATGSDGWIPPSLPRGQGVSARSGEVSAAPDAGTSAVPARSGDPR